jgi:type III secretion protein J
LLLAACSSDVADGLDERQSQQALAALNAAGVAATRVGSGEGKDRRYRIEVGDKDAGKAASVLRSQGLPRAPEKGFAEMYGSSSMIPSPTEEKARFLKALSGEIAQHLERFESVVDASVIVTAPTDDPLAPPDAPKGKPTASVLLKLRAGSTPPTDDAVKKLVAGAVENLVPADVAVVTEEVPAVSGDGQAYEELGPIRVARSSKAALVGVLAGACLIVIAMGAWILLGSRKKASA